MEIDRGRDGLRGEAVGGSKGLNEDQRVPGRLYCLRLKDDSAIADDYDDGERKQEDVSRARRPHTEPDKKSRTHQITTSVF